MDSNTTPPPGVIIGAPANKPVTLADWSNDQRQACSRITAQLIIHHESCTNGPTEIRGSMQIVCESDEQPYIRHVKVGPSWAKLDTGWVAKPGVVLLRNKTGVGLQTNPTQAERDLFKRQFLRVAIGPHPPGFIVRPGWVFHIEPEDVGLV